MDDITSSVSADLSWKQYFYLVSSSIASAVLSLALPLSIFQYYTRIIPNQSYQTLVTLTLLIAIFILTELIMNCLRVKFIGWYLARKRYQFYLKGLQYFQYDASNKRVFSELKQVDQQFFSYLESKLRYVVDLPVLIIYLIIITLVSPILSLIVCMIYAAFSLIYFYTAQKKYLLFDKLTKKKQQVELLTKKILSSLGEIKLLGMESSSQRLYKAELQDLTHLQQLEAKHSIIIKTLIKFVSTLIVVSIVITGIYLLFNQRISIGVLAVVTILATRLVQPLMSILTYFNQVIKNKDLTNLYEQYNAKNSMPCFYAIKSIQIEVEQEVLTFSEMGLHTIKNDHQRKTVAEALNTVGKASSVQIKTTPKNTDGVIIQTDMALLVNASILDNICLFNKQKYDQALKLIAKFELATLFAQFAQGVHTQLDENGDYSLGFKQIIAMLRNLCLVSDAIIFAGGISHLDLNTKQQFYNYLQEWCKDKIVIILIN